MSRQRQRISRPTHQTLALEGVLGSGGRALEPETRALLEPRFGHSFFDVRIHDDARAARAAEGLEARAFAVGQDIVMNTGEYNPHSPEGLSLLAHELTHTVQQRHANTAGLEVTHRHDRAEGEARDVRDRVMAGGTAGPISSSSTTSIAREDDDTVSRLAQTYSHDGFGLMTALPAAAADANLLARVGETVNPGTMANLGQELNAAGVTRAMQFAGPLSLGYGINGMVEAAQGPRNAESAGSFLANANSALSGGVTTLGLAGEGLTALGATGAGSSLSGMAAAAGPVGAVAGSFAGGYAIGNELNKHTNIGAFTEDYIGGASEIFGGGDRNWLLRQTESFDQNWDQGNYGAAAVDGLQVAGTATLGTLGGAAAWAGDGISRGAQGLYDAGGAAVDSVTGAAGDAAGWLQRGVEDIYR